MRRWHVYPWRAFLRRYSYAFAVLEHRLLVRGWLRGLTPRPRRFWGERARQGLAPVVELDGLLKTGRPTVWEEAWRITEALLRACRDEARSLGARFLLLVIPTRYQVQRDAQWLHMDWEVRNSTGHSLDDLLDWNAPEQRLAAFCRREGIEVRFLLGPLRRATALGSRDVYAPDGHLSWRGHELAAEIVAAWYLDGSDPLRAGDPAHFGSGPVFRVPPVERVGELDFTRFRHTWALIYGCKQWCHPAVGRGWIVTPNAAVLMPYRLGVLVLEGKTLGGTRKIVFHPAGSPPREFRLTQPGPFTLRLPRGFPGGRPAYGYTPVFLRANGEWLLTKLRYEEVEEWEAFCQVLYRAMKRRGLKAAEVLVVPPHLADPVAAAARRWLPCRVTFRTPPEGEELSAQVLAQPDFILVAAPPKARRSPKGRLPPWAALALRLLGDLPPGPPPTLVEAGQWLVDPDLELILYAWRRRPAGDAVAALLGRGGPAGCAREDGVLEWCAYTGAPSGAPVSLALRLEPGGRAVFLLAGPPGARYELGFSPRRSRYRFPFGVTFLWFPRELAQGTLDPSGTAAVAVPLRRFAGERWIYFQAVLRAGNVAMATNWVALARERGRS